MTFKKYFIKGRNLTNSFEFTVLSDLKMRGWDLKISQAFIFIHYLGPTGKPECAANEYMGLESWQQEWEMLGLNRIRKEISERPFLNASGKFECLYELIDTLVLSCN